MSNPRWTIVGLGEALFDIFAESQKLGGAPLNVAVHAHQLLGETGRGVILSRVGQDPLGQLVREELASRGMSDQWLQSDPDHATGQVFVQVDADGSPSYDIMANSAWDWLQFDPDLESLARQCDAVCFGSLAQRDAQTRNTIYRFLDACRPSACKLFDVNLRLDFYSRQIIDQSLIHASALKLNEDELPVVCDLLGVGSAEDDVAKRIARLIKRYELDFVIYTQGARGTAIYTMNSVHQGAPVAYSPVEGADSVGAGDACTAACLVGVLLRRPWDQVVTLANEVGAFVASQPGATPQLPDLILQMK